jgi:hypothetical protein
MPKKIKEKVEPYNFWIDPSCPEKQFTHAEFMEHLRTAHGIDTTKLQGKKSLSMHTDGDTWFSYVWDWEIAGKKFHQSTRQNRTGMNREIWAHGG